MIARQRRHLRGVKPGIVIKDCEKNNGEDTAAARRAYNSRSCLRLWLLAATAWRGATSKNMQDIWGDRFTDRTQRDVFARWLAG